MKYFGAPGDAPLYEETEQGPTPVGVPCLSCTTPIEADDRGFLIPDLTRRAGRNGLIRESPFHRLCFISDILGDLAHDLMDLKRR